MAVTSNVTSSNSIAVFDKLGGTVQQGGERTLGGITSGTYKLMTSSGITDDSVKYTFPASSGTHGFVRLKIMTP